MCLSKILAAAAVLVFSLPAYSQVPGCKDPMANNYDPSATVNNGSCTYNVTLYTPVVKVDPLSPVLNEGSGLQMAGGYLWSFNDGGGSAAIYRIDTLSNTILQTVNLAGATNIDWEDIAFDGAFFYIGDFGNNANGARSDLKIYKFPLSAVPAPAAFPAVTIPASKIDIINFSYADQPKPVTPTTQNNTTFDCEAMIVDEGKVHLFTKDWVNATTTHYIIDGVTAGTYIASPLETLSTNYLVTGADKVPGQNIIALLGYQNYGLGNHFIHLLTDYSGGKYFNGNKRRIDLPDVTVMGQAEGITFRNSTYGYISNEKFVRSIGPVILTVNQKLRAFNTSGFTPLYVLPVTLKDFTAAQSGGVDKITWNFDAAVENLELQYSINGTDFIVLKKFASSTHDDFYNTSVSHLNYYRLAWQKGNGPVQYSHIIRIANEREFNIGNLLLKANGELSFTVNSPNSRNYAFKLINTDGRILSEVKESAYAYGVNKIQVSKRYIAGNIVYLCIYTDNTRITAPLHVEK